MHPEDRDDEWITREERAAWPDPDNATTPVEAQVGLILKEYGRYIEPGPPGWERTRIRYFVRRGFVLVPDEHANRARELLDEADMLPVEVELTAGEEGSTEEPSQVRPPEEERPEVPPPGLRVDGDLAYGIRWLELRPKVSVFDALRVIRTGWDPRRLRRVGDPAGRAAAEHLVHIMGHTGPCPADEPKYVHKGTPPDPPVSADRCAGRGIRVLVVDTGLDKNAANLSWMQGVTGDEDAGIVGNKIGRYAGHGTFIAGVVRTMAPEADVIVRAGLPAEIYRHKQPGTTPSGTAFEGDLTMALERYIRQDDPDIISLSAGTLTESAEGLMVFDGFYDNVLRRHKGVVIVAAAGNDGARSRFLPAALPWTVSVGALSANWRHRAQFSNFGAWVDVYAPGEYLTNAFPSGKYTYKEPPKIGGTQTFEGMAIWSGTSFSTPVVAGLIAARMSRTGENGPDAAAALIAQARRDAIFGVGAILLPGEDHTNCRRCQREPGRCSCRKD